jgi:hypothetical protein
LVAVQDATLKFVDALKASGKTVKAIGQDRWIAQCSGHVDGRPSLSVMRGRGQVLMFCFAGCTLDSVAAGVGLRVESLFDDPKGLSYDYRHNGQIVRTVHRSPSKGFAQSIVDAGVIPLFEGRTEPLVTAVSAGLTIWIPEGEKDAQTLADLGEYSVASPMGAGAWAKADYTPLTGRSDLNILADRDEAGEARAIGLQIYLQKLTTGTVRILQSKVGKDVTDHVVAGLPLTELVEFLVPVPVDEDFELAVENSVWKSRVAAEAKRRTLGIDTATVLYPKSLGELLGTDFQHDWLIPDLLERRDRLILTGTEGTGKSHLLRQIAICAAAGIHPFAHNENIDPLKVLVIDAENSEQQWGRSARYVADLSARLGAGNPHENVTVSAGIRLDFTRESDVQLVHKMLDKYEPDVLYIGPLYKLVPKEISTDDDAAPLIVALDSFRERGVTMLMEAHAGHSKGATGDRDLRPRGSSALMGWPEFGMGLRPLETDDQMVSVVKWRGDREVRDWPALLRRGVVGEMPWMPVVTNVS